MEMFSSSKELSSWLSVVRVGRVIKWDSRASDQNWGCLVSWLSWISKVDSSWTCFLPFSFPLLSNLKPPQWVKWVGERSSLRVERGHFQPGQDRGWMFWWLLSSTEQINAHKWASAFWMGLYFLSHRFLGFLGRMPSRGKDWIKQPRGKLK